MANEFIVKKGLDVRGDTVIAGTLNTRDLAVDAGKLDGIALNADVTDTGSVVAALTAGENISISAGGVVDSVSGTADFVASGTLPNGAPVVLKSDGTVVTAAPTLTQLAQSIPSGAPVLFGGNDELGAPVFDPNTADQFVMIYRDAANSNYGTAVVGTVSGTSISFGSAFVFYSGTTYAFSVAFNPNVAGQFVIAYRDYSNSSYGTSVAGTISGTTITFGTAVVFKAASTTLTAVAFDPNATGKFVIAYQDGSLNQYGRIVAGNIAGTTLSFGSELTFNTNGSYNISVIFDPNTVSLFVISYRNTGNYHAIAIPCVFSGVSITFGSKRTMKGGNGASHISAAFDPNTAKRFVVAYTDPNNLNKGTAVVGTVLASLTQCTNGTAVVFDTVGYLEDISVAFDASSSGKFVVCYTDTNNSVQGAVVAGEISGTSITFSSKVLFNTSRTDRTFTVNNPTSAGQFVVAYVNAQYRSTAVTLQFAATTSTPNLTATNFLGTSTAAYTDTQTATIMLQGGISTNQTGLTIGSTYYVQPDGTLVTSAGTPSVEAGKALSATSLLLSDPADPAVALNTAKTGITSAQASAISANTAKTGITSSQASAITANTAKVGITAAQANAITANTAKTGITSGQASAITANTAKVTNSTDASDLTSGTLADARFPATLPTISGANLTNLPIPAAGTANFVASGVLPNGKPVILKADGTVGVVSETAATITSGSAVTFNYAQTDAKAIAFDPNNANKFVVCYQDTGNSSYGTAIVGTISGTSISFGSEYVFNSAITSTMDIEFDPNTAGKFVVAYRDSGNSHYGKALVGTVSGTVLSFGSSVTFESANSSDIAISFDPNTSGKFVVVYKDYGNSVYGTARVGTISGTSLSFGSVATFNSATTSFISISFDPNTAGKFVVCYKDTGNSHYGTAIVGTVSGTSLSFGSEVAFNSAYSDSHGLAFDPYTAGKCVITYNLPAGSAYAVVGTVSGTSITFGTEVAFNAGPALFNKAAFNPNAANEFVVSYTDTANSSAIYAIRGSISGTAITFGTEVAINSSDSRYLAMAYAPDTTDSFVMVYNDYPNSQNGNAILGSLVPEETNLTATNFLGTSTDAYTNSQTATIMLQGGVSTNQTGLTVGSTYYVQQDGTLSTIESSPSVIAGKALSTTDLFLANWAEVYKDPSLLVKTADYTTYAGDSIVVGLGGITITLPSSPSIGDSVIIKDGTGAVSVTPFTVAGNGSNIVSSASSLTFNSNWAEVRFVFINATIGWSV